MREGNTLTIDVDKKCSGCGAKGAAPNGLCLRCITKMVRRGRVPMAKKKAARASRNQTFSEVATRRRTKRPTPGPERVEQEAAQPPLIPMAEDELRESSLHLAKLVGQLDDLKAAHKAERTAMREEEGKIEERVSAIASTIRTQKG